jgi:nitroreductase
MMFDNDKTKEKFNLGENIEPICLIPIGYKTDDCPTNPQHDIRKDLSELVTYI